MCYVNGELKPKSQLKLLINPTPFKQPVLTCINGAKVAVRNKALHGKLARWDIFGKR